MQFQSAQAPVLTLWLMAQARAEAQQHLWFSAALRDMAHSSQVLIATNLIIVIRVSWDRPLPWMVMDDHTLISDSLNLSNPGAV
jgi:hypothetical protein